MQLEPVLMKEIFITVFHVKLDLFYFLVQLRDLGVESAFHAFHALASLHGCMVGGAPKGDEVVTNS